MKSSVLAFQVVQRVPTFEHIVAVSDEPVAVQWGCVTCGFHRYWAVECEVLEDCDCDACPGHMKSHTVYICAMCRPTRPELLGGVA